MKRMMPILAGAAVLALGNVALADEAELGATQQPIQLTDAQMDHVTAGTVGGSWRADGDVIAVVDAFGDNIPNSFAFAETQITAYCFGFVCTAGASAFAVVDGF